MEQLNTKRSTEIPSFCRTIWACPPATLRRSGTASPPSCLRRWTLTVRRWGRCMRPRSRRAQGHEKALAALDQALSTRESSRATGEPKGTYAPVDSTVFRGIYDAVMSAYRQNGGDAAKAIQAGASAGEKLTAQAAARAPKAARWGVSMKHYLQEFYKAPKEQEVTLLGLQIKYLTNQKPRTSTYQKYVNSWQDFLSSIGGGMNIRA